MLFLSFEVGLHKGQDGVAGRQVTDADAHKVFVHLRLSEQLIELRKRERERESDGESGRRERTERRDDK